MLKPVKRITVFLDLKINDEEEPKRVIIQLFNDIVPKTCLNFKNLCTGEKGVTEQGVNLHYKNSVFHRAIPGYIIQGGDITEGNGTGGMSSFEKLFEDENFTVKHNKPGIVTMANYGPDTNASQFIITLDAAPWLNGYHVAFGEVIEGMEVVQEIAEAGTTTGMKEGFEVKVVDCGEIEFEIPPISKQSTLKRR